MEANSLWKQPKWRLLVFRQAMGMLSAALVMSAAAAGVLGRRFYFTFAASTAGVLLLGRAWLEFCRLRDHRPLEENRKKPPAMLCRPEKRRRHKPAFLMNAADFDDDLTPYTAVGFEGFGDDGCRLARTAAAVLAGLLMIAVSFLIR